MKITLLVIGLALAGIVGVQSFLLLMAASFGPPGLSGAASTGIIVALLLIIGAGFAMSMLKVSAGCFAVAGVLAFAVGRTSEYHDLAVWGVVACGLGALAMFAGRGAKVPDQSRDFQFDSYRQPPADFEPAAETPITGRAANATVPNAAVRPVAASLAAELPMIDQLERLATLRASGTLSDEEFALLKSNLINQRSAGA